MPAEHAALDDATAAAVLRRHGLVQPDVPVQTQPLAGGVSAEIVLVTAGDQSFVLKRPLRRFRVAEPWEVDPRRARVEFEVAWFLEAELGRDAIVPILIYDDPSDCLVLETAPHGWRTWKERLLDGRISTAPARAAGRLLARLHGLVTHLDDDTFRNDDLFRQQRLDPYFATSAAREPDAAAALGALSALFAQRNDLVHGDFSPKNLFTDPQGTQVRLIDHEVTTRGDAAFDVAFLLTHLVLKAIHLPAHRDALHECARAFLQAYMDNRSDEGGDPPYTRESRAMRYLGGLLLARVAGKSRVEYLEAAAQDESRRLALRLLDARPERLDNVLQMAHGTGPP